jgi:hypothetical protein
MTAPRVRAPFSQDLLRLFPAASRFGALFVPRGGQKVPVPVFLQKEHLFESSGYRKAVPAHGLLYFNSVRSSKWNP